jgi:hypothetical protein
MKNFKPKCIYVCLKQSALFRYLKLRGTTFLQLAPTVHYTLPSAADTDPGSGAFLHPGSGMNFFQILDLGSFWIWLRLCSWKHKKQDKSNFAFHFACRIPDPGWNKVWIRIQDKKMVGSGFGIKHTGSATLQLGWSRNYEVRYYA